MARSDIGLEKGGDYPPFGVEGTWMYIGDVPSIHLLHVEQQPQVLDTRMEHFCLQASGLKIFLARLDSSSAVSRFVLWRFP